MRKSALNLKRKPAHLDETRLDDERVFLVDEEPLPRIKSHTEIRVGALTDAPLRPRAGGLAACLAVLCMAGYLVLGKHHVSGKRHDAGSFALCRQAVGAMLMIVSAYARHGSVLWSCRREHYWAIVKLGLLNYLNAICFIWGFKLTTPFVASVSQLSVPVMTYCYTTSVGLEAPTCRKGAGVCLIVLGCLLTAIGSSTDKSEHHAAMPSGVMLWLGLASLTLQTSSFSAMLVVQKPILDHYPVAVVVAWGYSAGAVFSLASSVLDGSIRTVPGHFNSPTAISIIIYSATIGALAYFELICFATKHLPASFVACSVALEPLAVSLLGILAFHYEVSALESIGYAIAMLGVAAMASVIVAEGPALSSPRRRPHHVAPKEFA